MEAQGRPVAESSWIQLSARGTPGTVGLRQAVPLSQTTLQLSPVASGPAMANLAVPVWQQRYRSAPVNYSHPSLAQLWNGGGGENHVHLTGDEGQAHAGQPLGETATGRDTGHCVWTNACLSGDQSCRYQLLMLVGSKACLLSKFTHLSIRFPFPTCPLQISYLPCSPSWFPPLQFSPSCPAPHLLEPLGDQQGGNMQDAL